MVRKWEGSRDGLLGTMAGNERLILQVGQNGRGTQNNRLSTGGVTVKIT